nr:hypothetical protein [Tanacetum cinerariifolium]
MRDNGEEQNVNEGFIGDLNGEQFPPINGQVRNMNGAFDKIQLDSTTTDCINAWLDKGMNCAESVVNLSESIKLVNNEVEEIEIKKACDRKTDNMVNIVNTVDAWEGKKVKIHNYWRDLEGVVVHVSFASPPAAEILPRRSKQGHWFSFEKRVGKGARGQVFRDFFWAETMEKEEIALMPQMYRLVIMSEYLRFPFLSGASISKGHALTSHDQIKQHTTRPLPPGQDIPEKTNHQKRVEVEDLKIVATRERKERVAAKKRERKRQGDDGGEGSRPATKRKNIVARKDGPADSGATSSPKPLRTINPTDPSGTVSETAESREDRSPSVSPHGSADHSVHNYSNTHVNEETDTLRLGTFGDQSWGVVEPRVSLCARLVHPPEMPPGYPHVVSRAYGPLGPSGTQLECGETVSKLVQARLDLAPSAHLYTTLSDRYKAVKSEHEGCARQFKVLESRNSGLSQVNKDQALRIKELEDELARKDYAIVYVERLNGKGLSKERSEEDLLVLMSRMEKIDVYADKKMRVEYDKLFEKQYPYVEKISRGFRHPVFDLLKVYPDSPPFGQAPPSQPSFGKASSTSAPRAS